MQFESTLKIDGFHWTGDNWDEASEWLSSKHVNGRRFGIFQNPSVGKQFLSFLTLDHGPDSPFQIHQVWPNSIVYQVEEGGPIKSDVVANFFKTHREVGSLSSKCLTRAVQVDPC